MKRLLTASPWIIIIAYQVSGGLVAFKIEVMRLLALFLMLVGTAIIWYRRRQGQASDLEWAIAAYLSIAVMGFWLNPGWLGRLLSTYPVVALYGVFFLAVAVPPLLDREPFTCHFARQKTPEAAWRTDLFQKINQQLTLLWSGLFAMGFLVSLAPDLWPPLSTFWPRFVCTYILPPALLGGIGAPLTRWYPSYRQRLQGVVLGNVSLSPAQGTKAAISGSESQRVATQEREEKMSTKYRVVAVNGSPHRGMGNTSQMIGMLKEHLEPEGIELQEIFLSTHHVEYCVGCAMCLDKGSCWIRDDFKDLVRRVLDADAVILASPVYIRNVTGQMKTFLDRSVGYGHRPRGTWKPGLSLSVSAGWGETEVARYLSFSLRIFGAFTVGELTAIAVGPGEFVGREAVAARAADLARDLSRAVKEERRYPATDQDLDYWHFMGNLIKENRDFMKADYEHWQKQGLLESFEAYVGQSRSPGTGSPEMRQAWLKNLMEGQRQTAETPGSANTPEPYQARPVRELLEMMPQTLNPEAAAGLSVIYQFEVSGSENFTAHLRIENQKASFREGPADNPQVIIKTPADIWLAISRGEQDGAQAFMTGKFTVEGDLSLLMKLTSLFSIKNSNGLS